MQIQNDTDDFQLLQQQYIAIFSSTGKPVHLAMDARKFAESICRRLFVRLLGKETDKTITLDGYLKVFREHKFPFEHTYPLIETIQKIGNYAGHDQVHPEPIDEEYVQCALCAVDVLVNWYVHNQLQRTDLKFSKGKVVSTDSKESTDTTGSAKTGATSDKTSPRSAQNQTSRKSKITSQLSTFIADIQRRVSQAWIEFKKGLKRVSKSFIWFFLTFLIGIIPMGIFWLTEMLLHQQHVPSTEELILRGDILAFSIVLISSLVWDYVILENKEQLSLPERFIFYGMPLVTIPFIAITYAVCQIGTSQKTELLISPEWTISVQLWILALTAAYAILTKLRAC